MNTKYGSRCKFAAINRLNWENIERNSVIGNLKGTYRVLAA